MAAAPPPAAAPREQKCANPACTTAQDKARRARRGARTRQRRFSRRCVVARQPPLFRFSAAVR
jgi:hypothetical protein